MMGISAKDLARVLIQPLVIVGVGNPMRGDDGFGPALAKRLLERDIDAMVIDAQTAPENYLGRISAAGPAAVLIADAADFGGQPGELRLIPPTDIVHTGASTHAASLALLEKFLSETTEARTSVLAVQPKSLDLGQDLTDEVENAVFEASRLIEEALA